MPRYIIERTLSKSVNILVNNGGDNDYGNVVSNNMECNATWLHSYISDDKKKTFCIYDAPSPEAVRKAAGKNKFPIDKITEVRVLDPYFYK
jgi:Nickel responsive protein SCO4226-like